jgi:hypothetical protein
MITLETIVGNVLIFKFGIVRFIFSKTNGVEFRGQERMIIASTLYSAGIGFHSRAHNRLT